jgi:glucan phosphoethanolaminetransferase (alkaline phosphatase superfamily)
MPNKIIAFLGQVFKTLVETADNFPMLLRTCAVFLALRLADVFIQLQRPIIRDFSLPDYFWATLFSFLLIGVLIFLQKCIKTKILQLAYLSLIALTLILLVVANYFVYGEFGEFITPQMIRFMLTSPDYLNAYLHNFLTPSYAVLGISGAVVLGRLLWIKASQSKFTKTQLIGLCLALIALGPLLEEMRLKSPKKLKGLETQTFLAAWTSLRPSQLFGPEKDYTRHNISPPQQSPMPRPNIIVVINESWGLNKPNLFGRQGGSARMPKLAKFYQDNKDSFVIFERAFTNSTATDISVPAILTGIHPDEKENVRHSAPLLWQWAAAAGYETFFATSQTIHWANFNDFLNPRSDFFFSMDELFLPIANEFGGDDILGMTKMLENLKKRDKMKPFLFVYFSNSLHSPFQNKSLYLKELTSTSRYDNALLIVDEAHDKLINYLKSANILNNTLMIITSDHGDSDTIKHRKVPRVSSFYDEITKIPYAIFFPKKLALEHKEAFTALKYNRNKMVSNVDIAATLVDFWGLKSSNVAATAQLSGQSLFQPISTERDIYCLSTNDTRKWDPHGFGWFNTSARLVYSTIEGPQYFRSSDPDQANNIWNELPIKEKQKILTKISKTNNASKMMRKYQTSMQKTDALGSKNIKE